MAKDQHQLTNLSQSEGAAIKGLLLPYGTGPQHTQWGHILNPSQSVAPSRELPFLVPPSYCLSFWWEDAWTFTGRCAGPVQVTDPAGNYPYFPWGSFSNSHYLQLKPQYVTSFKDKWVCSEDWCLIGLLPLLRWCKINASPCHRYQQESYHWFPRAKA